MAMASNLKRSVKEYRCGICGRIFDSAETLNSHKRMGHSQEGRQTPLLSSSCYAAASCEQRDTLLFFARFQL